LGSACIVAAIVSDCYQNLHSYQRKDVHNGHLHLGSRPSHAMPERE
jgi:hypothetical protein